MSNAWDEMRRAKEDSYFAKKEQEALERLAQKKAAKEILSPVTGEPMERVSVQGVNVDRCASSGGIWLDATELDHMRQVAHEHDNQVVGDKANQSWLLSFLRMLDRPAKKGS